MGYQKFKEKILIHLADGYKKKEEIIDMLNIDDFLYKDSIMAIKDEKNKRKIRMLIRGKITWMDIELKDGR